MEHLLDQTTSLQLEHIDPFLMHAEQERQPHLLGSGPLSGGLEALQHIPISHDRTNGDSDRDYGLGPPNMHPLPLANGVAPMSISPALTQSSAYEPAQYSWDGQNPSSHRAQKRKRTDSDIGDVLPKFRRIIQEQVLRRDVAARSMTTIVGYHASAAQKSYGLEKRFLCPPPLIRISGPLVPHLRSQALKMTVLSEMGATLQEQAASFDAEHSLVCFKQLHINSQGKDKSFQLMLSLADHSAPEGEPAVDIAQATPKEPWAAFYSNPVHIISKPSKKTTRGNTPGIMNLGSVALFNRINSQTVRTKYLSYNGDEGFTTSSSHWSPFTIVQVENGIPSSASGPIVYGSRIILKAPGFQSHEYIVRKVEKHKSLSTDYGRQVSQMQKIALLRADYVPAEGKVSYLSALVERPGNEPITVVPGSTHATSWRYSEVKREALEDGSTHEYHDVNDYATWMITSISQFQCTFFDATGANECPPQAPITPAPSIAGLCRWVPPMHIGGPHSLEMHISGFYSVNRTMGAKEQMQVWVGDVGPLVTNSYEGMMGAPAQPGEGLVLPTFHINAGSINANASSARDKPAIAFVAATLPSMPELVKALLDSVRMSRSSGRRGRSQSQIQEGLLEEGDLEREDELWGRNPSLPILFLRRSDGMGFHSGFELRCIASSGENLDNVDGWSVSVERALSLAGDFV